MTQNTSSSNNASISARRTRRRVLSVLFFGSMSAAVAALGYRLGEWAGLSWFPVTQETSTSIETTRTIQPNSDTVTPLMVAEDPRGYTMPVSTEEATAVPSALAGVHSSSHQSQKPVPTQPPTSQVSPTVAGAQYASISKPAILSKRQWGGQQASKKYISQMPNQITLHHEGVYFDGSTPAPKYLRSVQKWSINNRGWPDIPYHFLIDLDGLIYEGRPLSARGDTNTSYNLQDHVLIALLGKYDAGEQKPNVIQIDAIVAVMAWIADLYQIPTSKIHGHRDFIPTNDKGDHIDVTTHEKITCPGDNLYHYLADDTIQHRVDTLISNIRTLKASENNNK